MMKNILKNTFLILIIATYYTSSNAQIKRVATISKESEIDTKTYTGIIAEQYENGTPSLWKNLLNGKAEGLWLEWYPNGTLRYRAYWKNSLGNGRWEYFHPNGQLRSESFYINDIAQGIYRSYHENGKLKNDATYIDGNKDGIELTFDVNGVLLSRKLFENGTQRIDQPLIFQKGNISAENGNEWGINFMPNGNTAYFTRRDLKSGEKRIYTTVKTENGWSAPLIASFSTNEDEAPFINGEGNKLYFASYRPLPDGTTTEDMDMNIWFVERLDDVWSTPKPISKSINKSMKTANKWPANYEAGPMTDKEGNLYFWTKGLKNNATNIFYATLKKDGSYNKPIELSPPSSGTNYDTSPQLSPDGNILFFGSDNRSGGYGGSDLYYAIKEGDAWSIPKNAGPVINSSQSEGSPSFSPDGKYFYFSSNRGDLKDVNGERIWNLYYMESKYLMIK